MYDECLYESGGMEPTEWHDMIREADCGGFECCECHSVIEEDDKYEMVVANYEGDWRVYATCIPCKRCRESLFKHGDFIFGNLWKRIKEHYGLTPVGVDPMWGGEEDGVELSGHYIEQLERIGFPGRHG